MTVIEMKLFSKALNMYTKANVILPKIEKDMPVLYLLHGLADDADSWLHKTNIARYACDAGIAVVMPDGGLSCYEDMAHGERYREYIACELPRMMQRAFPISCAREKNFIAGCSMGGFGALKIGLGLPDHYAAVGCFSAAHMELRSNSPRIKHILDCVYGGDIDACDTKTEAALISVMEGTLPLRLYHAWGSADFIQANAGKTRAFIESRQHPGLKYTCEVIEGGHDWALWDECAGRFLRWLSGGAE